TPGIYVRFKGLQELLQRFGEGLVYLREDGEDMRAAELSKRTTFLLSDHRNLTQEEEEMVMEMRPKVLRVGPLPLHADHCILIAQNELDRRGL
ncbi:MAG: tRNA (pseudouridine(54)-N(1))-methyltransferase TrmY, partial [Candidatus Thermoplasmatota archaeon]|nr:tRNA (pseudouridine(54)-N(1))-methyltransferase TrmY [Candidatus Thermoplasmatota archaeon]